MSLLTTSAAWMRTISNAGQRVLRVRGRTLELFRYNTKKILIHDLVCNRKNVLSRPDLL